LAEIAAERPARPAPMMRMWRGGEEFEFDILENGRKCNGVTGKWEVNKEALLGVSDLV